MVRVPYRVDDGTIIIDTDYAFGAVECMRNEADELFGGPINTIAEFNRNKRKRRA